MHYHLPHARYIVQNKYRVQWEQKKWMVGLPPKDSVNARSPYFKNPPKKNHDGRKKGEGQ